MGNMDVRTGDLASSDKKRVINLAEILSAQIGKMSTATITRDTSVTPYTSGDIVANSSTVASYLTFADVNNEAGGLVMLSNAKLKIELADVPAGMAGYTLHLFSAPPTAVLDNAACVISNADGDNYVGSIDFSTPVDKGGFLWSQADAVNFGCKLADESKNLYGYLVNLGSQTPTAGTVIKVKLFAWGV